MAARASKKPAKKPRKSPVDRKVASIKGRLAKIQSDLQALHPSIRRGQKKKVTIQGGCRTFALIQHFGLVLFV